MHSTAHLARACAHHGSTHRRGRPCTRRRCRRIAVCARAVGRRQLALVGFVERVGAGAGARVVLRRVDGLKTGARLIGVASRRAQQPRRCSMLASMASTIQAWFWLQMPSQRKKQSQPWRENRPDGTSFRVLSGCHLAEAAQQIVRSVHTYLVGVQDALPAETCKDL